MKFQWRYDEVHYDVWRDTWDLFIDGRSADVYLLARLDTQEILARNIHVSEKHPNKMIGPFESVEAAKIAVETMFRLRQLPEGWRWNFDKK